MKIIGLTGGIGSGKSFVAKSLVQRGYPVYMADERAKALLLEDDQLRGLIAKAFGAEAYTQPGQLNRAYLAERVFGDKVQLQRLNNLVHPVVQRDFLAWAENHRMANQHTLIFKEAAILFEANTAHQTDAIWLVYAPKSLRIQRIVARDGVSAEQVLARMERQWPDQRKLQLSDFLLVNDDEQPIEPQVEAALRAFA